MDSHFLKYQKKIGEEIYSFASQISQNGGRALFINESVLAFFLNVPPNQWNIKVSGISFIEFSSLFGENIVLRRKGEEKKILYKFQDGLVGEILFEEESPKFTPEFTFQSVEIDILNGAIVDSHGGQEDIRSKQIRLHSKIKNPLSLLQALRFCAQYDLSLEKETFEKLQTSLPLLSKIQKRKINREWRKIFLSCKQPSIALKHAFDLGMIQLMYPELALLKETQQNPQWHPEGDVWEHTLQVVDAGSYIAQRNGIEDTQRLLIIFSCLCHDLGKPATTLLKNGVLRSTGHEYMGKDPTIQLLSRFGMPYGFQKKVIQLVIHHLEPALLWRAHNGGEEINTGHIKNLTNKLAPAKLKELLVLSEADFLGKGKKDFPSHSYEVGNWIKTLKKIS